MIESVAILGRQPALGLAELESLYGADNISLAGRQAALLAIDPSEVKLSRLGGTVKLAKLLTTLDTNDWHRIEKYLITTAPDQAQYVPEGKMHLGLSVYDMQVPPKQLLATGLRIKKVIQARTGKTVRLVPNKTSELNTAQVIHNKLVGPTGWELVVIRDGGRTLLAQTVAVQDIEGYGERDFNRPKRDARVGMLPPKLAQIMINLGVGSTDPHGGAVILDPFCGTGVILQEATLMGFDIYGSDSDSRMVDYTDQNLLWLSRQPYSPVKRPSEREDDPDWRYFRLEKADATDHQWSPAPNFVVSETYLGRPFTRQPEPEILSQTIAECNTILKKFLLNVRDQLAPPARLCITLPAWQIKPGQFKHLPLIDQISDLGYNRLRFESVRDTDLLYYRPDQIVARELLVITRK